MSTPRVIAAILSAPAGAAITWHLLWFTWFQFPGEIPTGRTSVGNFVSTGGLVFGYVSGWLTSAAERAR